MWLSGAVALQKEVAGILGAQLVSSAEGGVGYLHRTDADTKFFQAVGDGIAAKGEPGGALRLYLLTNGDAAGAGGFYLAGEEALVQAHGPAIATALDGRGGGKKAYQGKVKDLSKVNEALAQLRAAIA